jgi:hypothetical protein
MHAELADREDERCANRRSDGDNLSNFAACSWRDQLSQSMELAQRTRIGVVRILYARNCD